MYPNNPLPPPHTLESFLRTPNLGKLPFIGVLIDPDFNHGLNGKQHYPLIKLHNIITPQPEVGLGFRGLGFRGLGCRINGFRI